MEPIQAHDRVTAGSSVGGIQTLEQLGVRTSDRWVEVLAVEAGERNLGLPGEAGHSRDRRVVIASLGGDSIDDLDQLRRRCAVDHLCRLGDHALMFRQDVVVPLFDKEVDAEVREGWDHHHRAAGPKEKVWNQPLHEESQDFERCARQHIHRVVVPTVDDDVCRLGPPHGDPSALELVEPPLQPGNQPALEEWRHGVAQPFAETEIPNVSTRHCRFPAHLFRQCGHRS